MRNFVLTIFLPFVIFISSIDANSLIAAYNRHRVAKQLMRDTEPSTVPRNQPIMALGHAPDVNNFQGTFINLKDLNDWNKREEQRVDSVLKQMKVYQRKMHIASGFSAAA